ncbi:hypothetical protein T11_15409 [Trichinella zimbabwensis]|uniref:Uncharacterized protein n=1 Tax=Trichinella zimbabwensis TaxID=268475 RepID=A0A0V1I6B9_9BILA|nr:hypothetical protein T11_15409 [Trichinella zimbabwensis]
MSRSQRHSPALVRNEQKFSLGNQLTEDVVVLMAGCRSKRKSLTIECYDACWNTSQKLDSPFCAMSIKLHEQPTTPHHTTPHLLLTTYTS